jgi:hypothetical protein
MNTQVYLMGGLTEGRLPSERDLRQRRVAEDGRRAARGSRRGHVGRRGLRTHRG